jgi:hypothetical protein
MLSLIWHTLYIILFRWTVLCPLRYWCWTRWQDADSANHETACDVAIMHAYIYTHTHTYINVKRPLLNTQPGDIYIARGCSISQASIELILVVIQDKYSLENSNLRCMLNYWLVERESEKVCVNIFFLHFFTFPHNVGLQKHALLMQIL